MKFLILGDTHGCWGDLNITLARAIREHPDITHIVQVGDFGYGWPGTRPFKASLGFFTNEEMAIYNHAQKFFIDGNHENHDLLDQDKGAWQPDWQYMPRGSILDIQDECGENTRVLFFGGASSIDKEYRVPHRSWWPQESITNMQIQRTLDRIGGPITAIFSHEHPSSIPYSDVRYDNKIFGRSDKEALEVLKKVYAPKFWFFGHHHAGDNGIMDGVEWYCCPIIEDKTYTIWDGEKVTKTW